MHLGKGPVRRSLGSLRFKPTLLINIGVALASGMWLSTLSLYIRYLLALASLPSVEPRIISISLFVVGASLGITGAFWVYPLIPPTLVILSYAYGASYSLAETLAANTLVAIALMAALLFARRCAEVGSISIRGGRPLWWTAAILIIIGFFAGFALLMRIILESSVKALLEVIASLPYTLREFYMLFSSTRVGLGVFVAIVVAVGVRIITWVASPIVEGITATPQASSKEIKTLFCREVKSLLEDQPEASRWISVGVSTALSLALLPAVGSLAAVIEDKLSYLPGRYPRLLGISLSLILYALLWVFLRRISQRLTLGSLSRDLRTLTGFEVAGVNIDVLRKTIRVLVVKLLSGFIVALMVVLALNYAILTLEGRGAAGVALSVTFRGLAGESEPYSSFVESYVGAYFHYLSNYIENIERLLDIVIRLLWGR
jgi:hypothetical protein